VDQPTPTSGNSASPRGAPGDGGSTLRWISVIIVAVVAVSALVASFVAVRYEARLGVMARQLSLAHDETRRHEAALRADPQDDRAVIDLLLDPATRVIALRGPGPNPETSGRLLWSDAKGGRLLVAGLPAPPAGKSYALWTVVNGKAQPAGTFRPGAQQRSIYPFAPVPAERAADAFLVTLEPDGDHAAPTGSLVLASP
jgi:Anti-sigma-K factor rskA